MKPPIPAPRTCENCGAPVAHQQRCPWCGTPLTEKKPVRQQKNRLKYAGPLMVFVAVGALLIFQQEFRNRKGPPEISSIERSAREDQEEIKSLRKGLLTYRVLNKNLWPSGLDTMVAVDDVKRLGNPHYMKSGRASKRLVLGSIPRDIARWLAQSGMHSLFYKVVRGPSAAGQCDRGGDCRISVPLDTAPLPDFPTMFWTRGATLLTGQPAKQPWNADGNTAFLVLGINSGSALFNPMESGYMLHVPTYNMISRKGYNRYLSVWAVGVYKNGRVVRDKKLYDPILVKVLGSHGETLDEISNVDKYHEWMLKDTRI